MKKITIGIIFLMSLLMAEAKYIPIQIGNIELVVEVADTVEKRMIGLMFRKSIPDDYGMLFVFENETVQAMWMKNTLIPLDIVFMDKNRQVVDVYVDVAPCEGDPCQSYISRHPAKYALELNAKYSKKLNIKIGDMIFFVVE